MRKEAIKKDIRNQSISFIIIASVLIGGLAWLTFKVIEKNNSYEPVETYTREAETNQGRVKIVYESQTGIRIIQVDGIEFLETDRGICRVHP